MSKGYILVVSNKERPDTIKIVRTPIRPRIKTEDFIGIKESDDISTIVYYAFFKNFNKVRYNIFKVLSKNKVKERRKLFTLTRKMTLQDVIEIISKMKGKIYEKNLYHYVFEDATEEEIQRIVDEDEKEPEPEISVEDDEPEEDDSQYENDDDESDEEDDEENEEEDDEETPEETIVTPGPEPVIIAPPKEEPKVEEPAPQKIEKPKQPEPKKKGKCLIYILIAILIIILLLLAMCNKKQEVIEVIEVKQEEVVVVPTYTLCILNDAIKSNNIKEVKEILSSDLVSKLELDLSIFNMNLALMEGKFNDYVYSYDCEQHPLLTAIAHNLPKMISLLAEGDRKLLTFSKEQTPLMVAVRLDSKSDTIKTLLKYFNINEKNLFNETALMFISVYNPNLSLLELFIDNGAIADIRDNDNNTALVYALKSNRNKDFVKLLLNNTKSDTECVLKRLDDATKCISVNIQEKKDLLLITAVKNNVDLDVIETIIDSGANVNFFDFYGKTALKYAIESGKSEISAFLIEKGAIDFEAQTKKIKKLGKK
ncbi:MAG: ankyrin repeat domain-containing protein [Rickettsiales bacterium]|jgi:ankyrin repeat protein|nr:ankyrin repeat domain-containing protein [Rickettsiales bacterium]